MHGTKANKLERFEMRRDSGLSFWIGALIRAEISTPDRERSRLIRIIGIEVSAATSSRVSHSGGGGGGTACSSVVLLRYIKYFCHLLLALQILKKYIRIEEMMRERVHLKSQNFFAFSKKKGILKEQHGACMKTFIYLIRNQRI